MNFNDTKVRARVISHIRFAIDAATLAFAKLPEPVNTDEKMIKVLSEQLRTPIIMQLLSFTLNLDYQLKNSLTGADGVLHDDRHGE